MQRKSRFVALVLLALAIGTSSIEGKKAKSAISRNKPTGPPVLWQYPSDIASRNLFYGPGGRQDVPHGRFTFIKEDLDGTNPKFTVRDESGVKWKVKMGAEARPETAASRLVWAAGYFTNEDYFVPELHVENMPQHLRRGQNMVLPGGRVRNVRLKRYLEGEKKIGMWQWRRNPFTGSRQLNGLRLMMALVNNWDLKDENNSVYQEKDAAEAQGPERRYEVSDLGASFGTAGRAGKGTVSKGNLNSYRRSHFIRRETPEYVDFAVPARPSLKYAVSPKEFFARVRIEWIGHHIPRSDAAWMGNLLGQLSRDQIRDAFRAAGYSPGEVDGFSSIVAERIGELKALGDPLSASAVTR